jgi:hypothetical protein
VVNFVLGYSDICFVVVGHDRVAAVGIAGAARKVAAGYIDFDPLPLRNVWYGRDRSSAGRPARRERLGSCGRFAYIARSTVHQQHGAAVG